MAKSVEELGKQLDALQARVVAAENVNKKLRERAETAGITAAGTAGRAERFNVQGVSGGNGNLYFNSSRYSNRTPPKLPNDPGKRHQLASEDAAFLGQRRIGAHNKLKSHLPCLRDWLQGPCLLVSIHGEKLVGVHQKAWGCLLEATCNTEIEEKLVACSCVPEVWEVIQGWSLPTSDSSGVTFSFNSGHRRDGSDFPAGGVGQQHGS